jgi:hypothetical protein
VEVLGELHRERLAPRDVVDEREAPVVARAVGSSRSAIAANRRCPASSS